MEVGRMGRLQDERREETRQRLLEATVECLFERGYIGMTTAEVAQRAGVSKGAQQYHFPKKEELATAALHRRRPASRLSWRHRLFSGAAAAGLQLGVAVAVAL